MIDSTLFEIIFYCREQKRSRDFYTAILQKEPVLDVPGMTEFRLAENLKLGLMPEEGIAKILKNMPHPSSGNGIPRSELYLYVEDAEQCFQRAVDAGAKVIDEIQSRDWGDKAGYLGDPDGHVIVFAERGK